MDLHCSPPSNVLSHGLMVDGHSKANAMLAILDAIVKLTAEVPGVEAALIRDANAAKCPDECNLKSIGKPLFRAVSFNVGFDAKDADWHCSIGIAGEIDVMCEEPPEPVQG